MIATSLRTRASSPASPYLKAGIKGRRPTLDPDGSPTVHANIRVARDEHALWNVEAARRGYDLSAFVRQCVRLVMLRGLIKTPEEIP
jgi:hypothetical protein